MCLKTSLNSIIMFTCSEQNLQFTHGPTAHNNRTSTIQANRPEPQPTQYQQSSILSFTRHKNTQPPHTAYTYTLSLLAPQRREIKCNF
jgi:hypothetical protein